MLVRRVLVDRIDREVVPARRVPAVRTVAVAVAVAALRQRDLRTAQLEALVLRKGFAAAVAVGGPDRRDCSAAVREPMLPSLDPQELEPVVQVLVTPKDPRMLLQVLLLREAEPHRD